MSLYDVFNRCRERGFRVHQGPIPNAMDALYRNSAQAAELEQIDPRTATIYLFNDSQGEGLAMVRGVVSSTDATAAADSERRVIDTLSADQERAVRDIVRDELTKAGWLDDGNHKDDDKGPPPPQ